jgi:prepilin-type N-terminal cleavage/methylation domain-containing protein
MTKALAARRPGAQSGFTMIELTVALLAGLIVATGIVALSREATNTFHEEARSSAAEAALRGAIDRLRADIQRAGFMSTGNITLDPMIAKAPGQPNVVGNAVKLLPHLQSIHMVSQGSTDTTTMPLSGTNSLSPDLIEIAGNFSTPDLFDVAIVQPAASGANCQQITLSPNSPAWLRLKAAEGSTGTGATELQNVFQPDPKARFLVRLVDDTGHTQYLVTCGSSSTSPATGLTAAGWPYVNIDVSGTGTPLQTAQTTGTVGGISGYAAGKAWLNPVQVVRWQITTAAAVGANAEPSQFVIASQLQNGATVTTDPNKYDLMRTMLDADGNTTAVSEVVAEYAVDMKFAYTIDTSASVLPGAQPTPKIAIYGFGDQAGIDNTQQVNGLPTTRPERIRAVRVRLTTRTAQPDRLTNIAVAPAYGDSYIYRYCTVVGGCSATTSALQWARARTVTTDVALPNQARSFY